MRVTGGMPVSVHFYDGFAVLAGNRPKPTHKPHYVYIYWLNPELMHDIVTLIERA